MAEAVTFVKESGVIVYLIGAVLGGVGYYVGRDLQQMAFQKELEEYRADLLPKWENTVLNIFDKIKEVAGPIVGIENFFSELITGDFWPYLESAFMGLLVVLIGDLAFNKTLLPLVLSFAPGYAYALYENWADPQGLTIGDL